MLWIILGVRTRLSHFILAIAATAYGCAVAGDVKSKTSAYEACTAMKELTEPCKVVLGVKR